MHIETKGDTFYLLHLNIALTVEMSTKKGCVTKQGVCLRDCSRKKIDPGGSIKSAKKKEEILIRIKI